MGHKCLTIIAMLLTITLAPASLHSEAADRASGIRRALTPASASISSVRTIESAAVYLAASDPDSSAARSVPLITSANQLPPNTALSAWQEHILWMADIVLAILGYVGIMLARKLLLKIDRQTIYAETAAEAAMKCAQATLLHAEAIMNAERPWLLVTAEQQRNVENSFAVMVTNRGRTPAKIATTMEEVRIAVDEAHLPETPEFSQRRPSAPTVPIILLPGESTSIKTFSREDVRGICATEERFKHVENWDEKVFMYGKITYRDLIAPLDSHTHETFWCCWYIHGRQKSGLVVAGPPEYSLHT
jgi:hypothetical protein